MAFKLAGIDVDGTSVGGIETCIQLPQWEIAFDVGRGSRRALRCSRLLITHAHMDHAGAIAWHVSMRDLMGMSRTTCYVPRENHADFEDLFAVWRRLDRSELPVTLIPVGPGDEVAMGSKRTLLPFRSPHRVPCQGYAIRASRQKLLPELADLPGPEIHRLRESGVPITETRDYLEVAFTGDSVIDVVENEANVRTARLLIIEVTFLSDDVPPARARRMGHIHLDDIIERAHLFENEHILFTHFSARYEDHQVREILARRLPDSLKSRVTPFLRERQP